MPKGPLHWADEWRLNILLEKLLKLRQEYGERFLPSALLRRKVATKHLGRNVGMSFFNY